MSTTYDDIYSCFLDNCRVDNSCLPVTDKGKYAMIRNGCKIYNSKMEDSIVLKADDLTETINVELDDARLLVLAYCLKLNYHENDLTEFTSVWSLYQKEIGFKDYSYQIKAKEANIERTEQKITELVTNIVGFGIM